MEFPLLVLLRLAFLVHLSTSAVVLVKVFPRNPLLCPGSFVVYSCTTTTGALLWKDSSSPKTQTYAFELNSKVGDSGMAGVLNTTLTVADQKTRVLTSIANVSLIREDYEGRKFQCFDGLNESVDSGSADSESIVVQLLGPPSRPSNLSYEPLSFSSVRFNWLPPTINISCVTSYQVTVFSSYQTFGNVTTFVVDQLSRGQLYCATVSAIDSAVRSSDESRPCCFTVDVPAAVKGIRYHIIYPPDDDVVLISLDWFQPDPTRPEVLKYLVNYTVTDKDNRSLVLNTTVQSTPAILNYYKGSSYNVTVTPSNVLGEGPGSNISFDIDEDVSTSFQYMNCSNDFLMLLVSILIFLILLFLLWFISSKRIESHQSFPKALKVSI